MATSIEQELRQSVKTLEGATKKKTPPPAASALLADVFASLPGLRVPDAVTALAHQAARALHDADARASFFSLGLALWNRLSAHEALSRERAMVLAERLAPCARFPHFLSFLESDAKARGFDDVSAVLAEARLENFASFVPETATFGLHLLEAVGATHDSIELELDDHEQLKRAMKNGVALHLTSPGAGSFTQTGKRGGYGFYVSEKFENGQVISTLCSPWHDGEESLEPKDWVRWVLECLASLTAGQK
ncbi:MAG: hypothetical protein QM817_36350 [Archangium sp.]